ncbi:MAG: trigger factor [Peptostreptococcaceae bacterium]|nr:trigger factor [Peptostreptococcaceae bacterium]
MKATFISREKNEVKFTMEFTPEEFEAAVVDAYKASKEQFSIDGFRKGKAPRSIIEKRYGENVFYEDAVNGMFQDAYPKAVAELELEVIDSPSAEFSNMEKGKNLTVTITVPVYPSVEVKDYLGVEIEKIVNEVKDEDIVAELAEAQKKQARIESVKREAKDGDTVVLDYSGFVGEEKFDGGTAENQELVLGSNSFIPGFEEQLIGTKSEDKKDVVVTFPEEYQAEELAGKEAVFHCTVHEVKEEILPELDDDFAGDVSEFETFDEYRKDLVEKMQKQADLNAESQMKDKTIEKVVEANSIEVPSVMVEEEIDKMLQELNQQLSYQGLNIDMYKQFLNKNDQEMRDEVKEEAKRRVETRLILMSIAENENLEVSEEEVEEEIKNIAATYQTEVEEIKKMIGVENLGYFEKDIKLKKAIELIYEKAIVK